MMRKTLPVLLLALMAPFAGAAADPFATAIDLKPAAPGVSLDDLQMASLAAVRQAGDELEAYDPRSRKLFVFDAAGTLVRSEAVAGPSFVVEANDSLYTLGFTKPSKARPDADQFWVPGSLARRGTKASTTLESAVDLTQSVRHKAPGSAAYRISSILNFTVSNNALAAIGTLIADGSTQSEMAFFTYPTSGSAPVVLRMSVGSPNSASYYRVYNYMAESDDAVYFFVMDGKPTLHRWRSDGDLPPVAAKGIPSDLFGDPATVDPFLPPHEMMSTILSQERLPAGLYAKRSNGDDNCDNCDNVFVLLRTVSDDRAVGWYLARLFEDKGDTLRLDAMFRLPTNATQIYLAPSSGDGPWRLFEMAPLTADYRQPVERMIDLPSRVIEGGRRVTK